MNENEKAAKKVRGQKIALSILCGFLALVLFVMIFATAYVEYLFGRIGLLLKCILFLDLEYQFYLFLLVDNHLIFH